MATEAMLIESIGKERATQLDSENLNYILGLLNEAIKGDESELNDAIETVTSLLVAYCIEDETEAKDILTNIVEKVRPKDLAKTQTRQKLNQTVKMSDQIQNEEFFWKKEEQKASLVDEQKLEKIEAKKEKRREAKEKKEQIRKLRDKGMTYAAAAMVITRRNEESKTKSRDIHVTNFDLNHGKDLLMSNADLHLIYGRKYGLVGRNGSGKTTLLKAIAQHELPSIPSHLRILHVEQEVEGDEQTAVESVLACDTERLQLLKAEKELMEGTSDNADKLNKIHNRLKEIDADSAEPRACSILAGLGFTSEMQKTQNKEFSGGWRMRIALARALFCQPDVLLLDEPTNHLDLYAMLWLENYLQNWEGTLLIVSHQREFLNSVATDIIHLNNKKLDYYKGNFDAFEQTRYERLLQQKRRYESQQNQVKHIQKFIDRFRFNANRANLVQSRLKTLEKMDVVEEVLDDPSLTLQFTDPDPVPLPHLQFKDVTFGYDPSKILFKSLNIGIDMDSRVALVGANGVGKSTLLNLLAGELSATSGQVVRNGKLRFARFSQFFVESLDYELSPLENFQQIYPGVPVQTIRAHLGCFGLSGDIALRSIDTLSGGQKSRLVFAILAWRKPHILLLDEPTNHLDMETIDALVKALLSYGGGVLLISHDERLISLVCDTIWFFKDQSIEIFKGDFLEYKAVLRAESLRESAAQKDS